MAILGFIALYRIFQDYVLNPYLMSEGVTVPPLMVLLGLVAGDEIAGVVGVFLSVPVLAAAKILATRITQEWRGRELAPSPSDVTGSVAMEHGAMEHGATKRATRGPSAGATGSGRFGVSTFSQNEDLGMRSRASTNARVRAIVERVDVYFFIAPLAMPLGCMALLSLFVMPSFFIMSAHMVSFFIMASSFFMPSFLAMAT